MQRDKAYLLDIYEACNEILSFTDGIARRTFYEDAKTQSAVLHQLLILGEAVKRLSGEFRYKNDSIDWVPIAGMRDKLIHQYDAIDLQIVWNTISKEIPELIDRIEPLLPDKK